MINDKDELSHIKTLAILFYKKIYKSGDSSLKLGINIKIYIKNIII